ncbi:MAG: DNA mismatch repair endonuclease MutL [Ruminiclostridium sp.]|nr:DNA mismatch repair endonuclease MutL [Ruminiclostridium sp.]
MIKLLDKSVYELIAAGEVIERPASVIKELIENSVDAGAKRISVEIKNGGITYMRVTDDGCGMSHGEVPTAFLRHATSKLSVAEELENISTLGFRGEALASVAAVTRTELLTKRAEDDLGTAYKTEGGEETLYEKTGCPDGTTIILRDLFFNTPARLKFLKKDSTEANYVQSVVDRLALSYPDVAFTFIKDNKTVRVTSGDGRLYSVIYSVFGKQFAASLTEVDYGRSPIQVSGYITTPYACRANRQMQYFFINGRSVRNNTCMAALEEGYKNSVMVGKFPACVLNIEMPAGDVDVNVSPSKTEVRFADERSIFETIYLAVKNGILNAENGKETVFGSDNKKIFKLGGAISGETAAFSEGENKSNSTENFSDGYNLNASENISGNASESVSKNASESAHGIVTEISVSKVYGVDSKRADKEKFSGLKSSKSVYKPLPPKKIFIQEVFSEEKEEAAEKREVNTVGYEFLNKSSFIRPGSEEEKNLRTPDPIIEERYKPSLKFIGELFKTYIVCECGDELILMDKHAAHERIRFEELKKELHVSAQLLTQPVKLTLSIEETTALADNAVYLDSLGIELFFHAESEAEITAFPSLLTDFSPSDTLQRIASVLLKGGDDIEGLLFDEVLHTVACKGAIKANELTSPKELELLAKRVWDDGAIRYCPHGRPIITKMSKYNIERNFGRIQ